METKLRLLQSFPTEFEAELVRMKLAKEGIQAMVQAPDSSNVLPSLEYSDGIKIFVEPEDFSRAKELLDSTADDLTDDMDTSDTGTDAQ